MCDSVNILDTDGERLLHLLVYGIVDWWITICHSREIKHILKWAGESHSRPKVVACSGIDDTSQRVEGGQTSRFRHEVL